MHSPRLTAALTGALLALTLSACGSSGSTDVAAAGETAAIPVVATVQGQDGKYLTYAEWAEDKPAYADSTVVLYFSAPWCSSCRGTEESLKKDGVPSGLTLVKVDYDTSAELKKAYGITVQHSFVHVDATGKKLDSWTGSKTGGDILSRAA